jgi:hypothetical protein
VLYKPKAYRHPVLAFFSPDYLPGNRFDCQIDLTFGADGATAVQASFQLENDHLIELVADGKAGFALDVLSSETVSRRLFWVDAFQVEVAFAGLDLFGEVEIAPLLVAKEDISDFTPEFINPEYQRSKFFVAKGEPLAIAPVFVAEIQPDYLQPIDPFEIVSRSGKEPHWYELDTSSNKLILSVSEDLYIAHSLAKSDSNLAHMLFPSLYQDAVEAAIHEMQQDSTDSRYWARLLRDRLLESDIPLDGDPQQMAAQYLFKQGWGRILQEREER